MTAFDFSLVWIAANLLAFAAYGWDKFCATRSMSRIPEKTLLSLTLTGGIGAMAASSLFRHKTRKQPFRNLALLLAGAHLVISVLLLLKLG